MAEKQQRFPLSTYTKDVETSIILTLLRGYGGMNSHLCFSFLCLYLYCVRIDCHHSALKKGVAATCDCIEVHIQYLDGRMDEGVDRRLTARLDELHWAVSSSRKGGCHILAHHHTPKLHVWSFSPRRILQPHHSCLLWS